MKKRRYLLRLYVAGMTRENLRTLDAAKRICKRLSPDCELQVVDLLVSRGEVRRDRVVATPTLVKVQPLPRVWIMGDLLNVENVSRLLSSIENSPRKGLLRVLSSASLPRD